MSDTCPNCCPHCNSPAQINRYNKNGSVYYYCPSCKRYFTYTPPEVESQEKPKEENPQDDIINENVKVLDGEPIEGVIGDNIKKNKAEVYGTFSFEDINGVPTKDKMVEWFQIDETVWTVTKWVPKMWYMGYKDGDGVGRRLPLFGATLYIERIKRIECEIPAPAIISIKNPVRYKKSHDGSALSGRVLFASDFHIGYNRDMRTGHLVPFHDRSAVDLMITVAMKADVDTIVLGGDVLDLPEMTDKFRRDPSVYFTMRPAMIETKWILATLRNTFPETKIVWIEGNHEARMHKFVMSQIVAAYDLANPDTDKMTLSIEEILKLDELDVEWVGGYPNAYYYITKYLRCEHGDVIKSDPGKTAFEYTRQSSDVSVIFGHIHRREMAEGILRTVDGEVSKMAFSPGMMGIPERIPARTTIHNWHQGFCLVDYYGDRLFSVTPVRIEDNTAIYDGVAYRGKDYTNTLISDTGWDVFA